MDWQNQIIQGDSRELLFSRIPPNSIQLVVTSPPYYNERAYSHWNTIDAYFEDMKKVMQGCYRVLKDGGVICWNIQFFGVVDLGSHSSVLLQKCGFNFSGDVIIWVKPEGIAGPRVKHISGRGLYYPSIITEAIYIYYKGNKIKHNILNDGERSFILKNYSSNVWRIKPVIKYHVKTETKGGYEVTGVKNVEHHLAPFPDDLVAPFILAYSEKDDVVLDPFAGTATTCRVARNYGRQWCGIELDEKVVKRANEKLNEKDLFSL